VLDYKISKLLSLPEVKLLGKKNTSHNVVEFEALKTSPFEVCPKCATKSSKVYDHVYVSIKDTPIRDKLVFLKIKKRRFQCPNCKSIFREPIQGIQKGFRSTRRFRTHIQWCASNFSDLKRVMNKCKCSSGMVYKAYYEQLNLEVKKLQYPWPKTIGIDEHSFVRNSQFHHKEFATIIVDYNNNRVREACLGRSVADLESSRLMDVDGRENVKNVVMDMSSPYKKFVKKNFPNAIITSDKFHVIKLLNEAVNKIRIQTMTDPIFAKTRRNPMRVLYLRNRERLRLEQRFIVDDINGLFPELGEIYWYKESILRLYKTRGQSRAKRAFIKLTDAMALSKNKVVQSLRKTLMKWRTEILNYFRTKITNGKTEGYNRKAKLIQRKAYGYRNFENYRLRLIYDCR
jgi:transposase